MNEKCKENKEYAKIKYVEGFKIDELLLIENDVKKEMQKLEFVKKIGFDREMKQKICVKKREKKAQSKLFVIQEKKKVKIDDIKVETGDEDEQNERT